jgi:hypothetical protein
MNLLQTVTNGIIGINDSVEYIDLFNKWTSPTATDAQRAEAAGLLAGKLTQS